MTVRDNQNGTCLIAVTDKTEVSEEIISMVVIILSTKEAFSLKKDSDP